MAEKKRRSYTPEDIMEMVRKKEESEAFQELRKQMQEDFTKRFALDPYKPLQGFASYTSPSPLNDFRKVQFAVDNATLRWRVVVPDPEAADVGLQHANEGEEFLTGVFTSVNRTRRKRGEPPLERATTWFATARGCIAAKCLIYDDGNGTQFDLDIVDPMLPVWDLGRDGLVWFAIKYPISKSEAESRWDVTLETSDDEQGHAATVIDFFDSNMNCVVLVEGALEKDKTGVFLKEPTEHGLGHVPAFVGFAGSMPTIHNHEDKTSTLKHRATSVWAANRNVYEPYNAMISHLIDFTNRYVAGSIVHTTRDGKKPLEGIPWKQFTVIEAEEGETIKPLDLPTAPPEVGALLGIMKEDLQKGAPPFPQAYGVQQGAPSGELIKTLNDHLRSNYDLFTQLKADTFQWLCEELFAQFKKKGKKLTLKGFNNEGKFFTLDVNPADIKDEYYVDVTCEAKMPRDEFKALEMAIAATQPGPDGRPPLMSQRSARTDIMQLQNPETEKLRVEEEALEREIMALPTFKLRNMALALAQQGDRQGAIELVDMARQLKAKALAGPEEEPGAPMEVPPGAAQPPVPQQAAPGGGAAPDMQAVVAALMQAGITPDQVARLSPQQKAVLIAKAQAATQGGMPPQGV